MLPHDCENNSVYAGNPAKRIMSLDEFLEKKRNGYKGDLRNILDKVSAEETDTYLREYACLYKPSTDKDVKVLMNDTGYYEKVSEYYKCNSRPYRDLNKLIMSASVTKNTKKYK